MLLNEQLINHQIAALGEVKLNQYRTINVSPSITTRVEKRHVHLGDQVKKGALLATLHTISTTDISANVLATADLAASSAELAASIAEAKCELAAANDTWQRIQSLGRDAISGKRYTAAKIAKEQAQAKLKAYGDSQSQVKNLIKSGSKSVQKHFELRAEQAGMIIEDNFVLGQIVNPEDVLFKISDMDHPWVEAMIKPKQVGKIAVGSKADILTDSKTLQGKVVFIGRILDEKTRTLPVRIEVNAEGKSATASLYPGLFVKTRIQSKNSRMAISVPAEAVLKSADGDWVVFVEQASGRFTPKEVEVTENMGEKVIIKGIDSGVTIVSKGAFFVQSELAKSGFEIHNH
jgi:RND family efflux transporter MFP subunit